jgi:outer membrane receptor protein involved in Fe transport
MHDIPTSGRAELGIRRLRSPEHSVAARACLGLARLTLAAALLAASPGSFAGVGAVQAQETGSVRGTIASLADGSPVAQAVIEIEDTGHRTLSADDGTFVLTDVPAGARVLIVSAYFNGGQRVDVSVPAGGEVDVAIEFRPVPFALDGIRVLSASRVAQRVVESPVAIDVADKVDQRNYASTGQHPQVIKGLTGMDVSANGIHDFNVNTRGFNADLAQRLLVLMDGRDLAIPFLGSQEWSALSVPLDDLERIEVVRGPGSALYGANAYNGVINLVTPAPRAVVGTKLSLVGGELGTVGGDARVARVFGPGERFGIRANVGY